MTRTKEDATATSTTTSNHSNKNLIRRPTIKQKVHLFVSPIPREVRNLFAGGLAGMTAKTVVAPIDRIKIIYQVSPVKFQLRAVPSMMTKIVDEEGFSALWRGNSAMMLRVFPYSGIQFMVFDKCKAYFRSKHTSERHGITPVESLVAGSAAGVVSVIATYPLDLTRAQLAVQYKKKGGPRPRFRDVLWNTFSKKGVVGIYRGITPTLLGILPYSGVAFTINEQSKTHIRSVFGREPTTIEKMTSGGVAGLVAQSCTYPLEVTRRRMQTIGLVQGNFSEHIYKETGQKVLPKEVALTMVNTVKSLYAEQGLRGFFKGLSMNWMKGPIAFSISFTAYDIFKGVIESAATN